MRSGAITPYSRPVSTDADATEWQTSIDIVLRRLRHAARSRARGEPEGRRHRERGHRRSRAASEADPGTLLARQRFGPTLCRLQRGGTVGALRPDPRRRASRPQSAVGIRIWIRLRPVLDAEAG